MSITTWTIVIPYFNEQDYLSRCLECALQQKKKPHTIILVNNASTDQSPQIALAFQKKYQYHFNIILINEDRLGKIFALMAGCAKVNTDFFAIWDADTYYPSHYLKKADQAYNKCKKPVAAIMATSIKSTKLSFKNLFRRLKLQILSRVYTSECHAGGYAETFNTALYRNTGGFDDKIWPYMFEDHEIVQRLLKQGRVLYPITLWCCTSQRRLDRKKVTWTKAEKKLYRYTPFVLKDWFFYTFLASRFKKRGLNIICLRQQPWKEKAK